MAEARWEPAESQEPVAETGPTRALELTGAWYDLSRERLGWTFEAWYDAAVASVANDLAGGGIHDASVAALGASRAARARCETDTLADLMHALEAAGLTPGVDAVRVRSALTVGYQRQSAGESWFGDAQVLDRRLRDVIVAADGGGEAHTVIVVDVDLTWLAGAERGTALATATDRLRREFPFAEPVCALSESRFALVARRHPGLAAGSEALQMWLASEPLLANNAKVWLVAPPTRASEVTRFLRDLGGSKRSTRIAIYDPGLAARGGPGARLLMATSPVTPLPGSRRHRLVTTSLDGLGMVAAAFGALVLAVAIGRVVGPTGTSGESARHPLALGRPQTETEDKPSPHAVALAAPEPAVEALAPVEATPTTQAPVVTRRPRAATPTTSAPAPAPVTEAVAAPAPAPEPAPSPPASTEVASPAPAHEAKSGNGAGDTGDTGGGSSSAASEPPAKGKPDVPPGRAK